MEIAVIEMPPQRAAALQHIVPNPEIGAAATPPNGIRAPLVTGWARFTVGQRHGDA